MRIIDCEQGTGEWWEAKQGVPSASNFSRIFTPKTMKPSASADKYIYELVAEFASLEPPYFTAQGKPINAAMQHGINSEPEARRWFELEQNVDVQKVGFCVTDDGRLGCSPDALVGDVSGLEIKCPALKTQVEYLMEGTLPDDYRCQVHGSMVVTGRKTWHFLSYAPGLPPFHVLTEWDGFTDKLAEALQAFLKRYDEVLAKFGYQPRKAEAA